MTPPGRGGAIAGLTEESQTATHGQPVANISAGLGTGAWTISSCNDD